MTLDEDLVKAVDLAARQQGASRSEFAREAMRNELSRLKELADEQRHREGYRQHPIRSGEFDGWDSEQVWPD